MMPKMYVHFIVIMSVLTLSSQGLWSATLTVTSLLDNNAVGTLRTTINDAVSGDTIEFAVAGTITLNPVNGELLVNKKLTIDGGNQISINGGDAIPVCFRITGSDASESLITNIIIENFKNTADDGEAYALLIDNNANGCSVDNCSIAHIHSGKGSNAQAAGICALATTAYTGPLTNNTIEFISSEDNPAGESGIVAGILVEQSVGQNNLSADCSGNAIAFITSGAANGPSEQANGIQINTLYGNCNDNIVVVIHSGDVDNNSFSGQVSGIFIVASLRGNCIGNSIQDIFSGRSPNGDSGIVSGITIGNAQSSIIRTNTIQHVHSGEANELSGDILGINIFGDANATIAYNTIDYLISSSSNQGSGTIRGIYCSKLLIGNCNNNTITNFTSGNARETSGFIRGIQLENGLTRNCSNNVINTFQAGTANDQGFVIGIEIDDAAGSNTDIQLIACNQITLLNGGQLEGGKNTGIWLREGAHYTIRANSISSIHAYQNNGSAHGIRLGNNGEVAQDNRLELNIISHITAESMQSFGITIEDSNSTGNDILSNSIFAIQKKAINILDNGVQTDAQVTLTLVRCADGCKLIIGGLVVPFIAAPLFTVQFFVSDSNTPEQAQTLIGEYTHQSIQGFTFEASFSQLPQITAGQFITATATAVLNGSQENNNTSEVSNALPTCEPFGNVCPCPKPKPIPKPPCPSVNCGNFIL